MLKLAGKILISFFIAPIFYSFLIPQFIFICVLNETVRLVVAVLLRIRSARDKITIKLCSPGRDGIWEYRSPGNTRIVIASSIIKRGQLGNAAQCAKIMEDRIFQQHRTEYEKLTKIVTKCYGYVCWKSDVNFSVKNHIRMMDEDVEYTEEDHMELLSELSKDMEDESKPQWEMIILPKYKDSKNEKKSCFIFRFHHAYMDGMSLLMLFKKLSDDFEFTIDPLKFKIPFWKKIAFYSSCLLLGPLTCIQMYFSQFRTHWKHKSIFPGQKKIYRWTKVIKLGKLKEIKSNTKASIPNIVCLAFIKACGNVLPSQRMVKQFKITDLMAFLPYPNAKPQNRFSVYSYGISLANAHDKSLAEQLTKIRHDSMEGLLGPYALIYYYSMSFSGRLPYFIFPLLKYWIAQESFILSNVPAPRTPFKVFGAECEELGAFPPIPTSTGIILASISYKGGIKICGQIDSSCLSDEECNDIFKEIPLVIDDMANNSRAEETSTNNTMNSVSAMAAKKVDNDSLNNNVVEKRNKKDNTGNQQQQTIKSDNFSSKGKGTTPTTPRKTTATTKPKPKGRGGSTKRK